MINEIVASTLDFTAIEDDEFRQKMTSDGIDYILYEDALKFLGEKSDKCWKLNGNKIAKTVAHIQFLNHQKKICKSYGSLSAKLYLKKDFLVDWELKLPAGIVPDENLLHGIALEVYASADVVGDSYAYLPVESCGDDLVQRMKTIFSVKPKLKLSEIQPYITDIKPNDENRPMTDAEYLHTVLQKIENESEDDYYILSGTINAM